MKSIQIKTVYSNRHFHNRKRMVYELTLTFRRFNKVFLPLEAIPNAILEKYAIIIIMIITVITAFTVDKTASQSVV